MQRYKEEYNSDYVDSYKRHYHEKYYVDYPRPFMLPDHIMLLSFNYTKTVHLYHNQNFSLNYIHGELDKPQNIIFGYGDSTDPEFISNLFESQDSYTFRPYDYIKIENNVFCYDLVKVVLTQLPDSSTGIKVLKASTSRELKVGDTLTQKDEIKVTYTGNKDDIPIGRYIIGFTPYINEGEYDQY